MARLTVEGLLKYYGAHHALKGIDLQIPDGEFCVFVGPSGCGKSTLLRSIAGLEDIHRGQIAIGDRRVTHLPPGDRDIAMVFQNYALYPYLSVRDNIAFGLRARRVPETEVQTRVDRAATMLGIAPLLDRRPRDLSGGQRQRVAIGRAIVRKAQLFLFDEPLSNLDAQLRDGMRTEIKRLHQELGQTTVYVTHDQIEAMTLADRIVVLRDGRIEQQGTPLDLFERPATRFVASFLGSPQINLLPCRIEAEDGTLRVRFEDGKHLALPARLRGLGSVADRPLLFGIRPDQIHRRPLPEVAPEDFAVLDTVVDLVQPTGTRALVQFRVAGQEVTAELPAHSVERPGTAVTLWLQMTRALWIDPQTDLVLTP